MHSDSNVGVRFTAADVKCHVWRSEHLLCLSSPVASIRLSTLRDLYITYNMKLPRLMPIYVELYPLLPTVDEGMPIK